MRHLVVIAVLLSVSWSSASGQEPAKQDVECAMRCLVGVRHTHTETDADGNVISLDISEQEGATDEVLAAVKDLPHLREFYAIYCPIRGDGLKYFAELRELKKLDLFATQIDDRALKYISQIGSLTYLDVITQSPSLGGAARKSRITDDGVAQLAKLHNLESLRISGTITDRGLRSLAGLTKLRSLEIDSDRVTATGVAQLHAAIPGLEIQW